LNREELQATFEEVPELYDRARPSYPDEILDTYSGHRSMDEDKRRELFRRIRERMGNRLVRKTYLAILNVAHKR
jgi:hypothetical protein